MTPTISTKNDSSSNSEKSKGAVEVSPALQQHPHPQQSSSASSSSTMSQGNALLIRTVALNVLFHVLGIVFGFILFYTSFRSECTQRITQIMNDTNVTMQSVLLQHQEQLSIVSEYNDKLQQQKEHELAMDTKYQERIAEMKMRENSRLDEQRTLMNKHEECIHSKTILYDQLQQYQQNELNEKLQWHNITTECELLRSTILEQGQTIEMIQSNSEHQYTKLSNQLNLTKRMLHEKIEEVERLNTIIGNDTNTAGATHPNSQHRLTKEMTQIQADIKRHHYALTLSTYGKAPLMSYYVLMMVQNIKPNGVGPVVTLEIELNALYDMPQTTYTFLSLIENQLFHETSLSVTKKQSIKKHPIPNDVILTGGHPSTCLQMKHASNLKRSYAEIGYNIQQVLFFTERNTKYKCSSATNTIGFAEYGPGMEIYYHPSTDQQKSSPKHTCFGQIISGMDALQQLQEGAVDPKMRLRIIQTRIVKKDHIIKSNNQEEL
jgi:cyclophilin family peptidyl-prolyl cis-trans isomerase/phosphoribosylanthranilate isomerase